MRNQIKRWLVGGICAGLGLAAHSASAQTGAASADLAVAIFPSSAPADPPPTARPYPIQTTATPQAGVYYSFAEWRQNQPRETGRPAIEARPYHTSEWAGYSQIRPYWPTPEGRREPLPADTWGFSDGEQVYVRFERDYYLLERRGPHYLFFAPAPPLYSPTGTMAGGVLGGAMGGLILGSGSDGRKFPFALSIHSGQIMPYDDLAYATELVQATTRPTTLLLLYPAKAVPALRVAAPGHLPRTLAPHDFASFSWPAPPTDPLCAGPAEATPACQELALAPGEANYYECVPGPTPGSPPSLRRLDPPAGRVLLRRLMR